ncbi:MBG domain-containing protein [Fulvitalea axinellae]
MAKTRVTNVHPDDLQVLKTIQDANPRKLDWKIDLKANTIIYSHDLTLDWNDEKPRRLTALRLWNSRLEGSWDLRPLDALTELNCAENQLTGLDLSGTPNLKELYCSENQLRTLDLSKNTNLEKVSCYRNQLQTLTLSANNTNLTELSCWNNQLTTLDLSTQTNLKEVHCATNQLSTLTLGANTALELLDCSYNQLTALDLSKNTALDWLRCNNNQLTVLDVSNNTALRGLHCSANQFTTLDLKANTALQLLSCEYNQLTILDLKANTALRLLSCENNQLTTLDLSANTTLETLACTKNQLTTLDLRTNTTLNWLRCQDNHLTTLDLRTNTKLKWLDCHNNQLTALDLSKNTALVELECSNNQLTALDLTKNTVLSNIKCYNNQLRIQYFQSPSYDSWNFYDRQGWGEKLLPQRSLKFSETDKWETGQIIDLSSQKQIYNRNSRYEWVDLRGEPVSVDSKTSPNDEAKIRKLETGKFMFKQNGVFRCRIHNTALRHVYEEDQYLETASYIVGSVYDDKELIALQAILDMQDIQTANDESKRLPWVIDLEKGTFEETSSWINTVEWDVSKIPYRVTKLDIAQRKLKGTMDLSPFTALKELYCSDNQLTSLNLSANTVLTEINCSSNQLTALNLSTNTALMEVTCSGNQLAALDLITNTKLHSLYCHSNQLSSLDLSANPSIVMLECSANQLTALDLSANTSLKTINCSANQLTTLDLSANTSLKTINCSANQLTTLGLSANTSLTTINCSRNQLTTLGINTNVSLVEINCSNNQLTSLDLSTNTSLERLECSQNALATLDLNTNPALKRLHCNSNQLTTLDLNANTVLQWFICSNNQLTTLNISANTDLATLDCSSNQLKTLNISQHESLKSVKCENNHLKPESFQSLSYKNWNREVANSGTVLLPQTNVELIEKNSWNKEETLNLTSYAIIFENPSRFEWVDIDGNKITTDTETNPNDDAKVRLVEDGKFQFKQSGAFLCRIYNDALANSAKDQQYLQTEIYYGGKPAELTWELPEQIYYGDRINLTATSKSGGTINYYLKEASDKKSQIIGNVLHAKTVESLQIEAKLEATEEYQPAFLTKEINIQPRILTVTPQKQLKIIGEEDPALEYTITGLIDGDKITGELSREEGEEVGKYKILIGTLDAGENYTLKVQEEYFSIGTLLSADERREITASPNPVSDQLSLRNLIPGNIIELVNLNGITVKQATVATNTHSLNCSGLAGGVYILRVNGKVIQKIVKQ